MSVELMIHSWKSSNYRRKLLVGLALAALVSAALLWATPGVGDTITVLQRSTTDERIKIQTHPHDLSDIAALQVTIQPGGNSGWHSHPGPGLVAIKAGVAALYDGNDPTCTPKYVTAGNAFFEEANHVHFVQIIGAVAYQAYATFVLPLGAPARIDAANPGNCRF